MPILRNHANFNSDGFYSILAPPVNLPCNYSQKSNKLSKHEEDYYKHVRIGNFYGKNYLMRKVMVIKTKPYQSKNALMKLDHT